MDLLLIVSTPQSGPIATELGKAALRAGLNWGVFLTNDGVRNFSDHVFADTIAKANRAIACHESWAQHMGDTPCPVETGSQTNNSTLVGEAAHIVSL